MTYRLLLTLFVGLLIPAASASALSLPQLKATTTVTTSGKTAQSAGTPGLIHKAAYYCPFRAGYSVRMYWSRGKARCRYTRVRRRAKRRSAGRWRRTRAAWRACRRKYGRRLIKAYENRYKYRCIYRRR